MAKNKFDYFEALDKIVGYACDEARELLRIMQTFDPATIFDQMNEMHHIENSSDIVNHEIYEHLAIEFITPIERDDILLLAERMDEIVDSIEDVTMRLYMYDVQEIPAPVLEYADLIVRITEALHVATQEFKNFRKSATIRDMLIQVSDLEDEGDRKYVMALRHLHTRHKNDGPYVYDWENIVSMMEECCDKCAHAGDAMSTVIMKNT